VRTRDRMRFEAQLLGDLRQQDLLLSNAIDQAREGGVDVDPQAAEANAKASTQSH
jgi:hypothetical protein